MPIRLGSQQYNVDNQIKVDGEVVLPRSASATAASLAGAFRYNPAIELPQYFDGVVWQNVGTGGGGGDTIITGTATVTGDGLTSQFLIPHMQGVVPTDYTIDPITPAAQGIYSKDVDATNFIINYDVSPIGTMTFNFTMKISA